MLTRRESYLLAADTGIDPRTVQRAYRGEWVVPALHAMLEASASKLGVEAPPPNPPRRAAKAVAGE